MEKRNTTKSMFASFNVIFPEGKGLLHLMGSSLSLLISRTSFLMYPAPDTRHNPMKPKIDIRTASNENRLREKKSGKKIIIFLYHCLILISFIIIFKDSIRYCNNF